MARDRSARVAKRAARRFAVAGSVAVAQEFAPEASEAGRKVLWKVVAFGSGSLAALVSHQLVKLVWSKAVGGDEPDPMDPDTPLSLAVGWAVSIAVGVVVGRRVGHRLAAKGWEKAFHEPPPKPAPAAD
ncbi:MAG: DUF4235 domain-containing protein [Acidimicrobiales bacterium]|nr:DUF4235 domain-containing protein [Acidimicrobiales bacterium]